MQTQVCKQCGELKPIELFRKYYGNRRGYYKTCKVCEKINSREKYLRNKADLTDSESIELEKIHTLYEAQRAAGLQRSAREPAAGKRRGRQPDGGVLAAGGAGCPCAARRHRGHRDREERRADPG